MYMMNNTATDDNPDNIVQYPRRAHLELNQGPADLQSAALTTELCTHPGQHGVQDMRMRNREAFSGTLRQEFESTNATSGATICGRDIVRLLRAKAEG